MQNIITSTKSQMIDDRHRIELLREEMEKCKALICWLEYDKNEWGDPNEKEVEYAKRQLRVHREEIAKIYKRQWKNRALKFLQIVESYAV